MDQPRDPQSYAQGYEVGYKHGLEAAGGSGIPPTDQYPINLVARYPEQSSRLGMFLLPFRWFALLPHLVCLYGLSIAGFLVMVVAWFAVVINGNYPRPLWDFMVGVYRWQSRVTAYMICLTDEYPPFSLT